MTVQCHSLSYVVSDHSSRPHMTSTARILTGEPQDKCLIESNSDGKNHTHELHCFDCQTLHSVMTSYSISLGVVMGLLGKKTPQRSTSKRRVFSGQTTQSFNQSLKT